MSQRFFLDSKIVDGEATLDGDQAHHVIHVMRLRPGEEIVLFDGQGTDHQARIVSVGKKQVQLDIRCSSTTPPKAGQEVTLAVALPKGDRQRFLVEKLVELNVDRLIPLQTSRSVAIANPKAVERMKRQVIEACKQCGRNYLMDVDEAKNVTDLVSSTPAVSPAYFGDPSSDAELENHGSDADAEHEILFAIGPEGGFTPEEHDQFVDADWQAVSLGPNILRIETAAIVAAVMLERLTRGSSR